MVDTNVLVSAIIADGPPARVLDAARVGDLTLLVPDLVRDELVRVLAAKMNWERDRLLALTSAVDALAAEIFAAPDSAPAVSGDPTDDRILACAVAVGADALVTGDRKHLLPLRQHRGVRVLSPQALLAELRA